MLALLSVVFVATLLFGLWELKSERVRFASLMILFAAAMAVFVTQNNEWILFACWEVMGFCSFQLIAQKEKDSSAPSAAALRAFLLTKLGDLGFLAAVLIGFDHPNAFWLLAFAAAAKSAQFPFQSWLVGAMAGPSAASALIHSATMVVAGVILLSKVPGAVPEGFQYFVAFSAVLSSLWAIHQSEPKKILAYLTVAQIGLMYLSFPQANEYLLAHGFYKATLFLLVGVYLKRKNLGVIGAFALLLAILSSLGFPFFKSHEAKAILWSALEGKTILQAAHLITLSLSAWATARFARILMSSSIERKIYPVEILPLFVVVGGLTFGTHATLGFSFFLGLVSFVLGIRLFHKSQQWSDPTEKVWNFLGARVFAFAKTSAAIDSKFFDSFIDQIALSIKALGRIPQIIDDVFINNALFRGLLVGATQGTSLVFRKIQKGRAQFYIALMFVGFWILFRWVGVN